MPGIIQGSSKPGETLPAFLFGDFSHLGYIVDGVEDTTSEEIRKWYPSFENYTIDKLDEHKTLFKLNMDATEEFYDMFLEIWPKALRKLKEVSESDM